MVSAISLLLFFVVLGVVLLGTLRSPLKDDIAWLLYVARRWMGGRELYIDLVEVNPPLIVWMSAIPLAVADWFGVAGRWIAMPTFIAIVLGSGLWATRLLRRNAGLLAHSAPVFAVIGSILLILPGADLGQREHLLVAAFLPYLVLFAQSLDKCRPTRGISVGAGLLAGLGCALKPQYASVFAVLEVVALTRGLRPWRVMPVTAAMTLAGYAASVALICPAYLHRAVPMALALYGATNVPFLRLVQESSVLLAGEAAAIILLCLRRRTMPDRTLMLTLVIFAAVGTGICFWDGKDWFYHRLPASVATLLALLLWAATEIRARDWSPRLPMLAAALAAAVFCIGSFERVEPQVVDAVEVQKTVVDRLESIIEAEHARTYVAFSEWLALGFPVVNNTGVTWASRFDSMWALKGEVWRARFDPMTAKEWPVARWVSHDFIAGCPDIVVVDTRETTPYIQVLSAADPAFARVWTRYKPITAFDGLVIYKRRKAGCLDMWVAAESVSPVATR